MAKIQKVGVLGAGTMGNGIAQVFAQAGTPVSVVDTFPGALEKAKATIEKSVRKVAEKAGKSPDEEARAVLGRIAFGAETGAFEGCDLVVEAIVEDLPAKVAAFRAIDAVAPAGAILASNTSSISITRIAAATKRPASVVGMHFMNPVPVMKLVEIIRGQLTSDETAAAVVEASKAVGKIPVEASDFPGFVSNRVLMPMINEAIFCLHEGVAKAEAIDEVMKLGMNHPIGPLALADLIGNDVCLAILEVLQRDLGDDKYRPCPLLRRMVAAGLLGRKTGRGFFDYAKR
ncbi:MAG: 3-hydroxybutyryl-CoA dehydrogenase [Planctomycetaceae bacterium]|nr:3-hydroxyacyl-CoA dehydrogenase NAD-binding domain-containing protein [Planctomycetota bacterium]MCK6478642.1 3-hydroxyacyl-CoA dehydrogenase NAD-binding domain-containing protein [Planctomycetota bacterium]NUN51631.1 3-hydroxybutyryl-CoA dehydrogenase [Planctomycetaceae bacterium]